LYRRWHACSLDVLGTAQSSQPSDQEYHSRASCALTLTILCVADTFRPIARYVGKAQEESERLSDCGISIRLRPSALQSFVVELLVDRGGECLIGNCINIESAFCLSGHV
jgi:hypothetical protein